MVTQQQVSAGGVVCRHGAAGSIEVVLVATQGGARWGLPKGLVAAGEDHAATALREVREETGLVAAILAPLTPIEYWYWGEAGGGNAGGRVRFHKRVHFYLMACRSGDMRDHDWEVDDVQWFEIGEAGRRAAFRTERQVLAEAQAVVQDRAEIAQMLG